MKKYILITMASFLFLASCGEKPDKVVEASKTESPYIDLKPNPPQMAEPATEQTAEQATEQPAEPATEQPAEPTTEQMAEPATKQPAEPATEQTAEQATEQPAEPVFIFQECRLNLSSALWTCTKEEQAVKYLLDQEPSRIDDQGTENERKRICELHGVAGTGETGRILHYAHYEKDWCTKKLNEKLEKRQTEGYTCEAEVFVDENKPDDLCPSKN